MNIDLHVHTNRYSRCSTSPPESILHQAVERGLDAVVFTDHNAFWPEDELEEFRDAVPEIKLFNGAEIDVPSLHHVLTVCESPAPQLIGKDSPESFKRALKEIGGFAISAHPFRFFRDYDNRNREHPLPGVEIMSGHMSNERDIRKSEQLADFWNSRQFASSDAHSVEEIGCFYTELDASPTNQGELIEALETAGVHPRGGPPT
ncbi:MAG: PHP domain-containing protein [bacterium]